MRTIATLLALALLPVLPAGAQTTTEQDAHAKLNAWQGAWRVQIRYDETPYSHKGASSYRDTCSWLAYGGYMVCDGITDAGPRKGHTAITIMAYDTAAHIYKHIEMSTDLKPEMTSDVTLAGNTWSFPFPMHDAGKTYQCRDVYTIDSADRWHMTFSIWNDGTKQWTPVMHQQATRV